MTATRGFASMDPTRRKKLAAMGGRVAHILGVAHRWTSEEARAAGRLGGLATKQPLVYPDEPGECT